MSEKEQQIAQSSVMDLPHYYVHVNKDKQNTSSLHMISLRGRVVSSPPIKVVGGS